MRCGATGSVRDVDPGDEQAARPDRPADWLEERAVEEVEVADQVERQPRSEAADRGRERRRGSKAVQLLAAPELLVPMLEPFVHRGAA